MFSSFWRIVLSSTKTRPSGFGLPAGRLQAPASVLAGLDLLPELGVLRELVRQRLIEQVLQRLPRGWPPRGVAAPGSGTATGSATPTCRRQRIKRARRRLGSDGKRRFDRLEQPLRQGTLLILEQEPGGLPVLQRQVLGILIEVVAPEQPVDDDQLPKFRLGPGGEERGEPDQRPLPLVLDPGIC